MTASHNLKMKSISPALKLKTTFSFIKIGKQLQHQQRALPDTLDTRLVKLAKKNHYRQKTKSRIERRHQAAAEEEEKSKAEH